MQLPALLVLVATTVAPAIAAADTFTGTDAVFAIAVTPKAAGDRTLTVDVKLAVCSSTACEPQRRSVAVSLHVQ